MLILLFIILLVAIVFFLGVDFQFCSGVLGVFEVIVLIALIFNTSLVVDSRYIDQKITICEEGNAKIEEEIDVLVKEYMRHEADIYSMYKAEDSMTMVQLIPELKSNELIQSQMNAYKCNTNEIKYLKNKKIEANTAKWWVYFGG